MDKGTWRYALHLIRLTVKVRCINVVAVVTLWMLIIMQLLTYYIEELIVPLSKVRLEYEKETTIENSLENSIGKLAEFPVLIGVILIGSLIVTIILGFIHRYGG